MSIKKAGIVIIYDGDCPFCSNYISLIRLKENVGRVELIDARKAVGKYKRELQDLEVDLDEGMAIHFKGRWFIGSECVYLLSVLSSKSNLFNKVNAYLFKRKYVSYLLYPFMRLFRNLTLWILGRKKINLSDKIGQ